MKPGIHERQRFVQGRSSAAVDHATALRPERAAQNLDVGARM